ncbi:conserved hypothetical protein [Nitrospira lenta]|uniref:Uncharacterized protein n=1 Tax=Nitrospira lenta TaxID=1436998 RepID=A0A330LAZ8_9BACT|nr:conserved hypothetical protein [Nitrospira lenta]
MASFTKVSLTEKWDRVRAGLSHAFSTRAEAETFTSEDLALLQRIADAVVQRRMAAPAVVFLESLGPMSFLGSQAMHFFAPIIELAFSAHEVSQVAALLERRDTTVRLVALIEVASTPQGAAAR